MAHFWSIAQFKNQQIYLAIGLLVLSSYLISHYLSPKLWWMGRLWFFLSWIGLGCVHYANQRPERFETFQSKVISTHGLASIDTQTARGLTDTIDNHNHQLHALVLKYQLKSWGQINRYIGQYYHPGTETTYPVVVLTKDSALARIMGSDKTLWTNARPKIIESPPNPGGFDLKTYYHSQGIERAVELTIEEVFCWDIHPLSLRAKAQKINEQLAHYWRYSSLSPEAKALALAIILGQTKDLTPEIRKDFAQAGALHVLALSGLHVGLVVLLLQSLFRPLKNLPLGTVVHALLLLGLLWGYAIICGLSPSITRAVCMFTVWQMGQILGRPISGTNSVLMTFILMLWWCPYWLFSVGFQLSFSAVMALTYIPSRIQNLWRPRNRIFRYFVQLSLVGIAAQIGVGPLTVYYFHQFPLLFWLSNLMVLPLMTPLLVMGILITTASLIAPVPEIFWETLHQLLQLILNCVQWISGWDEWLLTGLNISRLTLLFYYLIFLMLWWGLQHPWLSQRRVLGVYLPFACILWMAGHLVQNFSKNQSKPQFAFLHRYGSTVLLAHTARGYEALVSGNPQNRALLLSWTSHHKVTLTGEKKLPPIMSFDGLPVIVIDSLGTYPPIEDGIVILTKNANIHFETLVKEIKPRIVLADASNYKPVVDRWKSKAKGMNQKFLDTYSLGAIETVEPEFKKYF